MVCIQVKCLNTPIVLLIWAHLTAPAPTILKKAVGSELVLLPAAAQGSLLNQSLVAEFAMQALTLSQ
jgi:hypothetical protein